MKIQAPLKTLANEISRNPRLQAGAALILLLILGWIFLVLGDWRKAEVSALTDAQQRLTQVRALAGQKSWENRADGARKLADALSAEIPPVASAGLAQADFQNWLRELVNSQGTPLRLDVQAPVKVDGRADVVKVTATISGSLPPGRVQQLIGRIEGRTSLSTVPVLSIRSDDLNQTFSLTVQSFYRLPVTKEPGI